MRCFFCHAFILLFAIGSQAADTNVINLKGHTGTVNSVTFSPDGMQILTASGDATARIWDAHTGVELKKFEGHKNSVLSAAYFPDGKRIVTASEDSTVRIWDANPSSVNFGKELKLSQVELFDIGSVNFSPDRKKCTRSRHFCILS